MRLLAHWQARLNRNRRPEPIYIAVSAVGEIKTISVKRGAVENYTKAHPDCKPVKCELL